MRDEKLRAIDLYSGVGGWSFGLTLAGIDLVASYERWGAANKTNVLNNGHPTHTVDIRTVPLGELPTDVDLVVGSPPCTEFSTSNRGGGGNIEDGLKDIIRFFTIVDYLRPKWWVMENVPRAAAVIDAELAAQGCLEQFKHLNIKSVVFNLEDFGIPQRRKRLLVGNLDFDLLRSYTLGQKKKTLGDVVSALSDEKIVDPLFGITLLKDCLHDHDAEAFLDLEERRINEAAKVMHPIYNTMPFPDRMDRSVRTITATCTRVSRESVIIEEPNVLGSYRRLTARERACLQGFPITYQFFGSTYAHKLRMIGNAVPPAFAFYVGHAIRKTEPAQLPSLESHADLIVAPQQIPPPTTPDTNGRNYPPTRTFRFAVPNLRLKSGVRFELTNLFGEKRTDWGVRFYFGNSKDIHQINLDLCANMRARADIPPDYQQEVDSSLSNFLMYVRSCDIRRMQAVWSHHGPGGTRPFDLLDQIELASGAVIGTLRRAGGAASELAVWNALAQQYGTTAGTLPGIDKLMRNAPLVHAGILIGSTANVEFARLAECDSIDHGQGRQPELRSNAQGLGVVFRFPDRVDESCEPSEKFVRDHSSQF